LPAFGGKGMYGLKVHQAVIDAAAKSTGCTVHFVDNQYDHGPILLQREVEVLPGDTAESLQARVHLAERELYPEALRQLADRESGD
jgi:folate-dependent phosphoribosylglycinamide formyltransferase PurN